MRDTSEDANTIHTVCQRDCPDTCFVDALVRKGKLIATRGSKKSSVTRGFLCPRGAKDPERVYSKDRVLYPYIKENNAFRKTSWQEALDYCAEKLKNVLQKNGAEHVLLYDYAGNQGCLSSLYPQRLWRSIGATLSDGSLCCTSGHVAIGLHYGSSYGLTYEDVRKCGTIVFWGNNAKISSPHLWALALKAKKEKGAMLVSVDPRESETSEGCDLWINPYPGSDVALAYGIATYWIQHNKIDRKFLAEHTSGFAKYASKAGEWSPERVEETTHLTWWQIEDFCEAIVEKAPVAFMLGLGLNKSSCGAEAARAVSLLPALLGQSRGFHYSDSRGRFVDFDYVNGSKLATRKSKLIEQVTVGPRLKRGEFKFVFVSCANPALTLPDQDAVRAGFSRDDLFVVVHETHWTETAQLADVVLPAATYLEKTDLSLPDHYLQTRLSNKTIEPLGESKHEIWVMQQLAKRIGCLEPWLFEDPLQALRKAIANAFEDGSFDDLLNGAVLKLRQLPANHYQTSTGKIEFYSSKAIEIGVDPLPTQLPAGEGEDSFVLLNSSLPNWTNSQFRDVYGPIPMYVWINPLNAEVLGVKTGDKVALLNSTTAVTVEAVVTAKVPKNVLWSPRPFIGNNGVPLNSLASSQPQTLGSTSRFNSIRVKIKKEIQPILAEPTLIQERER